MLAKLVSLFPFKERAYNNKVEEHEVWARNTINRFRELSKQYGAEGKKKAIEDYLTYLELTMTKVNKLMDNENYAKLPDKIGLDLATNCYGISTPDNSYSDLVELTNLNNYLTSKHMILSEMWYDVAFSIRTKILDSITKVICLTMYRYCILLTSI